MGAVNTAGRVTVPLTVADSVSYTDTRGLDMVKLALGSKHTANVFPWLSDVGDPGDVGNFVCPVIDVNLVWIRFLRQCVRARG